MTVPENTSKDNSLYALVPAELTAKFTEALSGPPTHAQRIEATKALYKQLSQFVDDSLKAAKAQGKTLCLAVGETHNSNASLMCNLLLQKIYRERHIPLTLEAGTDIFPREYDSMIRDRNLDPYPSNQIMYMCQKKAGGALIGNPYLNGIEPKIDPATGQVVVNNQIVTAMTNAQLNFALEQSSQHPNAPMAFLMGGLHMRQIVEGSIRYLNDKKTPEAEKKDVRKIHFQAIDISNVDHEPQTGIHASFIKATPNAKRPLLGDTYKGMRPNEVVALAGEAMNDPVLKQVGKELQSFTQVSLPPQKPSRGR